MYPYKIVVLFLAVFKLNCICLGDVVTAKSVLKEHNDLREADGAPELSLSKKLSKDCEDYAKHLATLNIPDQQLFEYLTDDGDDRDNFIDHFAYPISDEKKTHYTESICEFSFRSCVSEWYQMGKDLYDPRADTKPITDTDRLTETQKFLPDKYTALIWISSKEMGVGIAPKYPGTKNLRKIMVVRYSPPGNVRGEYNDNIPEPEGVEYSKDEEETTTMSKACGKKSYIFAVLVSFQTLTHWFP